MLQNAVRNAAAVCALALTSVAAAQDQTWVVPQAAVTTAGSGGYSTLLRSQPRSYQVVIGPEELGGIPAGSQITGITWRRPSWQVFATWPGQGFAAVFPNYDITLSTSVNPPGALSTTATQNIGPDAVLVRSGPLTIADAFFPGGALTPQINPFGTVIPFAAPYTYAGGTLLITVRHQGHNIGANGSLDTVGSVYTQALGVDSYTQETNWYPQGLIVTRLSFTTPSEPPCPGDFNSDGQVTTGDITAFLSAWFADLANGTTEADADGSGATTTGDISFFLGQWFQGVGAPGC
ncbi:MAG TPA: hypothetical protein VD963_10405 [Phycisphaerales bacterium]|nr:hypothetical protein [Phycisphaerales bacterium]